MHPVAHEESGGSQSPSLGREHTHARTHTHTQRGMKTASYEKQKGQRRGSKVKSQSNGVYKIKCNCGGQCLRKSLSRFLSSSLRVSLAQCRHAHPNEMVGNGFFFCACGTPLAFRRGGGGRAGRRAERSAGVLRSFDHQVLL